MDPYMRRWCLLIVLALHYTAPWALAALSPRWAPWAVRLAPLCSLAALLLVSRELRRNARAALWDLDSALAAAVRRALPVLEDAHPLPGSAARTLRKGLQVHDRLLRTAAEVRGPVEVRDAGA